MGIFERLERTIASALDGAFDGGEERPASRDDPDLASAEAELDEFLRSGGAAGRRDGAARSSFARAPSGGGARPPAPDALPREVAAAFSELGLPPRASRADCKQAYHALIKRHHPDKAGGGGERFMRIKAAFDALESWHAAH